MAGTLQGFLIDPVSRQLEQYGRGDQRGLLQLLSQLRTAATGGADKTATYITEANETAKLPNSFQLFAGTNITFTLAANALTINSSGGGTSPLTTKGDIFGHSTVDARIPVGADTFVLTADSTQALGVKWAPGGAGTVTSLTATAPIVAAPSPITGVGVFSHAASGVAAATYGDSTHVAQIAVDANGHITSASSVATSPGRAVLIAQVFGLG